jgi:hypothetical protein
MDGVAHHREHHGRRNSDTKYSWEGKIQNTVDVTLLHYVYSSVLLK